jgi:hypothetical protein
MFNSAVFEVAIGLVFCYCSVSVIVSSINEAIASALDTRAATLLASIKTLLDDPNFSGLARDVYNHASVNPLGSGQAVKEGDLNHKPSYIPSRQFAIALIDILQKAPSEAGTLDQAILAIQDPKLKQLLQGMYLRAAGDVDKLKDELAGWFDGVMDQVAGNYKKHTLLVCFLLGFAIAAMLNIDTFHLFKTLWENPGYAAELAANPSQNAAEALKGLQTLPIGWTTFPPDVTLWGGLLMVAGWLLTACSVLFGAPFWFDLLQNFVQLRGSGPKPGSTAAGNSTKAANS